jgi:alpha-L-fucosidase
MLVLEDGTPIRLRFASAITSAGAKIGDTARLEVVDDVNIGGLLLIPSGSKATGRVVDTQHKRMLGLGGKLGVTLDWVQLEDGSRVAIRAEQELADTSRLAESDQMLVRTSIEWAVAPFIVIKGKDVVIARGSEVTAYCDGVSEFYTNEH